MSENCPYTSARWYGRNGWWVRVGSWSLGWTTRRDEWGYRPLFDRSWWLFGFCLRHHDVEVA